MENKIDKIKKIVLNGVIKLGEEEEVKSFQTPSLKTKIRTNVDSMEIVVLSVDLEEKYEEVFDKEIKILNEDQPNFMENFDTVETLINYINNL